jgi:hypothetical protein
MKFNSTITITFGDQAENNVNMQKIGQPAINGFSIRELKKAKTKFEELGYECELIMLSDIPEMDLSEAGILVIRKGADAILEEFGANSDDMFLEQRDLEWDTKAKMYGRVVDKHARHNLCYGDIDQEPDYENGKGRIIHFDYVPCTQFIRKKLPEYFGPKARDLIAEGNLYFDLETTGVGFHGDLERKKVIAVRLGAMLTLHYQWFLNRKPIGPRFKIKLNTGDVYIMSEKAVGTDWKKTNIPTLRHATGAKKYLQIK